MNAVLLFFNLLPVYPLDGGQILRGLLWLRVGPIRSVKTASIIGFGEQFYSRFGRSQRDPSG
jgi:Zn-dependent protease